MTDRLLQYFAYSHLPAHLQAVSKPFCDLAQNIVDTLPQNPERTVALRKLLEAKDCAVSSQSSRRCAVRIENISSIPKNENSHDRRDRSRSQFPAHDQAQGISKYRRRSQGAVFLDW